MAAPVAASAPLRTPLIVERYAIYDEIASGGMATVHFARLLGAQGFRRTVAAKRLLPHLTRDTEFSLMLIDEARLAARIRHPNVVSTLDVVQTESELVLVMDYVHGESLSKLVRAATLRGEAVPVAVAAAILIDALHGLHAAHEAKDERGEPLGIVHRDVSPQNLLVGTDGITRIADFGIAKAAGRSHTTRDGSVKGKFSYMAPEQLNQGAVTRVTDVFAAAVVLWELLTGKRLFDGSSQAETVFRVMNAEIPAPSSLVPGLDGELDRIVAKGLARNPDERFASARDMALALESWAPPIRPSEIAAWVERIAEDGLLRRQRLLAAIEHAPDVITTSGSGHEMLLTPGRARASLPPAAQAASEAATVFQPSLNEAGAPKVVEPATGVHRVRRSTPRMIALGILLLLAGGGLFLLTERHPTASSESSVNVPAAVAPAPVITPGPAASEPPREAAPAAAADEPTLPRRAPLIETKPERDQDKPDRERTDRDRGERAVRKPAKGTRDAVDCDPPFSIDATGKRIFKVECM